MRETVFITLIAAAFLVGYWLRDRRTRNDYRRAPAGMRRAAYNNATHEAESQVLRYYDIRAGKIEPATDAERRLQSVTPYRFAQYIRDTYERYGLDIQAEMYWSKYLGQHRRFDIVTQEGDVVYFEDEKQSGTCLQR